MEYNIHMYDPAIPKDDMSGTAMGSKSCSYNLCL